MAQTVPFLPRGTHTTTVFNDKMWLIGGTDVRKSIGVTAYLRDIWSSNDGINWTLETGTASFSFRSRHTCINYDNKLWVIGGGRNSDVYNSADGKTWIQSTSHAPFSVRDGHSSVVFDNKMWVIGGRSTTSSDAPNNDVWYSTDGAIWTLATEHAAFSPRYYHSSLVFDNKIWVIGGTPNSENYLNDIWYSKDGITWTLAAEHAEFPPKCDHSTVVFNNKIWLIGGRSTTLSNNDIWSSSNGINWEQISVSDNCSSKTAHSLTVFKDKLWLIGGVTKYWLYYYEENTNGIWSFTPIP